MVAVKSQLLGTLRKTIACAQKSEADLCNSENLPLNVIFSCDCQYHCRSGLESYPHTV